ncbi:zinc finger protein basonuclin-2 isoform X2 [Stegostoma tigrinum]|uniref:zinc finger protein basonuclin-2 isoform X2 n=1 Tax=Stegostoma tigrinum TaxID=3053191 RepID=UPI00202B9DBF|nr:zinc finger protein basonuclin-2 isoform X2 [Stegostoma tigrinum]
MRTFIEPARNGKVDGNGADRPVLTMSDSIRCTLVNCNCECFQAGKINIRQCDHCKHGWVVHALDKLQVNHLYQQSQVEIVQSNVVFDISSLMLYGTQAIPIRLKILLDRLFSVLKQEEVLQILHSLGWTLQDYIRGYILQDASGKVLDRWSIMTYEEEMVSLNQFLRFGETKSIVELMAIQEKEGHAVVVPPTKNNSDIRAFIESSNQTRNPALAAQPEKLNASSAHHFENIVNNLAFMLPFQFFNPIPMPLLGASPKSFLLDQPQDRPRETKREIPIPVNKGFLVNAHADFFPSPEETSQNSQDGVHPDTKNNSASEYSGVISPALSVTPKHDIEQLYVPSHIRGKCVEKAGSLTNKGRVYCSACEKTFYDKGTLKIHYNAVHLKIKHKCTVEGCNMVFSSLRSRNRHSSNPNPRLHMPTMKNNRDKDLRNCSLTTVIQVNNRKLDITHCPGTDARSLPAFDNPRAEPANTIQTGTCNSGHSTMFQNLKTVQPVLPFYRSLVPPSELAIPQDALPHVPVPAPSIPEQPPVPKKKSRKSSMPVKIEKESMEGLEEHEGGPLDSSGAAAQHRNDSRFQHVKDSLERTESRLSYLSDPEEQSPKGQHRELVAASDKADTVEKSANSPLHLENGDAYVQAKTVIISSPGEEQRELEPDSGEGLVFKSEGWLQPTNNCKEVQHGLPNGGFSSALLHRRPGSPCSESPAVNGCTYLQPVADKGDNQGTSNPNYCYVCKKVFKSSYSVKLHYKNVHLKEMHLCTVGGCNAAFPSRRSRDRHSANINLHHKLLTKGSCESQNINNSTLLTKEPCKDILGRTHMGQAPVILKAKSKNEHSVVSLSNAQEQISDAQGGDALYDGAVLDLSTTSSVKSGSSIHSWDSDAGSDEGVPVNDEDIFEHSDLMAKDKLYQLATVVEKPIDHLMQTLSANSPIMCNICQKMYSNKGTFRAHYKTVHLRQLHKCKVPGCSTMFSSVRSRNRHSQNPNLHKDTFCSSKECH